MSMVIDHRGLAPAAGGVIFDTSGRLIVAADHAVPPQQHRRPIATGVTGTAAAALGLLSYLFSSAGWLLATVVLLCLLPAAIAVDVARERRRLPQALIASDSTAGDPLMPPLAGDAEPVAGLPGWFRIVVPDAWRDGLGRPAELRRVLALIEDWATLHVQRQQIIAQLDDLMGADTPYDIEQANRFEDHISAIDSDIDALTRCISSRLTTSQTQRTQAKVP